MKSKRVYFVQYEKVWSADPLMALYLCDAVLNNEGYDLDDYGKQTKYYWTRESFVAFGDNGRYVLASLDAEEIDWIEFRDEIVAGLGSGKLYCSDEDSCYAPTYTGK